MPGVLTDNSSRARALARQRDTEISRNASLGISFCFYKSAHSIYLPVSPTIKGKSNKEVERLSKAKRKYFYPDDFEHGLRYELVGDYYLIAGDDEPENAPLGYGGSE